MLELISGSLGTGFRRLHDFLVRVCKRTFIHLYSGMPLTAADAVNLIPSRLEDIKDSHGNVRYALPSSLPHARVIEDVHKYWSDKRGKLKKALMRRFWLPTV